MTQIIIDGSMKPEDFLLASPYEDRNGRNLINAKSNFKLTEKIFHDHLYASPIQHDNYLKEDELRELGFNENEIKTIRIISNPLNTFEISLFGTNVNSELVFIRGYSGCGKTTYISTKLYELAKSGKAHKYIVKLQNSRPSVYVLGPLWENSSFHNGTIFKLYSALLYSIDDILMKDMSRNENGDKIKETDDGYRARMKVIWDCYSVEFAELLDDDIRPVFLEIGNFIEASKNLHDFYIAMHAKITQMVSDDATATIRKLVKMIQVTLYCINKHTNKKCYFVLDGIEHYIKTDIIFDEEIPKIVNIYRDTISQIKDCFERVNIQYEKYFRNILVIRDTTFNMMGTNRDQDIDFDTVYTDISRIYRVEEIYNKKTQYFSNSNIIEKQKKLFELLQTIVGDAHLMEYVSNMYNYNKRRMTSYLISALMGGKNFKKTIEYEKIKDYIDYSEEVHKRHILPIEGNPPIEDNNIFAAYKNGARFIIIRMLLDLIQSDKPEDLLPGYFTRIKTVDPDNSKLGYNFARRLLLYLNNKLPDDNTNNYVGFYTLINDLFRSPCNGLLSVDLTSLAELLFTLSDRNKNNTDWVQLITLKFCGINPESPDEIKNILKCICDRRENDNNYEVKITSAGRSFIRFSPHYEYFACRYRHNSAPLFILGKELINKENCLTNINFIKEKAFACIDEMLKFEEEFYKADGFVNYEVKFSNEENHRYYLHRAKKGEEETHGIRILNNHIGYLNNFRLYLINESLRNKKDKEQYASFINDVLVVIGEYIDKFGKLVNEKSINENRTSYFVGNMYHDKYTSILGIYNEQLATAQNDPLNISCVITGRR
jgi:hypothetical protein